MTRGYDFTGKQVTVVGLGTLGGGVGVARYAVEQGASVTVTDMRDAAALASSMEELEGLPITYHLGSHDAQDFLPTHADMVVRNPGVPRNSRFLQIAREHGVPIEMEMSLFFRACPAPTIGVTGTKGKTTVSTLIGEMLLHWDESSVVAGNMGVSALASLSRVNEETPVVIELSSWQLEALYDHGLSPHVSVLTNIHEDHLNHYDGYEDYARTKRSIAAHASEQDVVVYNADQSDTALIRNTGMAQPMPFSTQEQSGDGAWMSSAGLHVRWNHRGHRYELPTHLSLSGETGRMNALAAIAAATARGVPEASIAHALQHFAGVPNRLETVRECGGVAFINDSSATAPVAAAATIRLLRDRASRLGVIAGGSDKSSDFAPMASAIADSDVSLHLLAGDGTMRLIESLGRSGATTHTPHGSLEDAFRAAVKSVGENGIVVLTPGCASFGMFRNEFERGARFRQLVSEHCDRTTE